jgi:subtilisin family serine protease
LPVKQPKVIRNRIVEAKQQGAVVVAAAGNAGSCRPFWPAALSEVLAVGATDDCGERAWFSNYGPWVDASAPGVDVVSTFLFHNGPVDPAHLLQDAGLLASGEALPEWIEDPDHYHGWAMWSGTSFSAPRVAAAIARRMCESGLSAEEAAGEVLNPESKVLVEDLGIHIVADQ